MKNTCIALRRGKCTALEDSHPRCNDCAFYKTKAQQKYELALVYERIADLPFDRQQHIADTYYDGQMPWLS